MVQPVEIFKIRLSEADKRYFDIGFYYSTKQWRHSFSMLTAFFVRHSSDYEASNSDLLTIIYLKSPSEKTNSFYLHKTGL